MAMDCVSRLMHAKKAFGPLFARAADTIEQPATPTRLGCARSNAAQPPPPVRPPSPNDAAIIRSKM
jgi:hypothetical protein